jgi:Ca-activated chloride channel family protein
MTMAHSNVALTAAARCTTALLGVALALLVACSSAPPAEQGGAASTSGAAAVSALEEITVTGTRVESRAGQGRAAPSGGSGLRRIQGQTPLAAVASAGTELVGAAPAGAQFAGMRPGGNTLLSQVQPGEEIWVIQTSEPAAQTEDDSPGSGTMLALVPLRGLPRGVAPEHGAQTVEVPLPLRHTDVHAVVTGYISAVDVTQQFENPYDEKIEAVYLFPLPEKAAVNEFVMTIGERKIRGILREKEEAHRIYEDARAQGYRASLLVQHRPNIFEQKVANIEPGKRIDVNIRYFHTLAYEDGWYSFVFPTVVGPRYNPQGSRDPVAALPRTNYETPAVGTAVRYLRPNERSAHDIGISVDVDAGVAIEELTASHEIATRRDGESRAHVALAGGSTMPNRDFILKFRVAGATIKSNLLARGYSYLPFSESLLCSIL